MRKAISILLSILFVFNTLGFTFVYLLSKVYIHYETVEQIKALIPDEDITYLSFSKTSNEVSYINDEEFVYKNCLYDVISSEVKNDTINILCIKDDSETNLELAYLNSLINNNLPSQTSKNFKNILQGLIFVCIPEYYENKNDVTVSFVCFEDIYDITAKFKEIILPPPKQLLEFNII